MEPTTTPTGPLPDRVHRIEFYGALRGIWSLEGEELVVEIDQETGALIACNYQAEMMDPRSVVTRGVLLRSFEGHAVEHSVEH